MGLEFGVKVVNMARDNGLCVCVVKPHGVSDKHSLVCSETRWSEGHDEQASKKKNRNSSKACQTISEIKHSIELTKTVEPESKGTRTEVC